ncbi:hypothetical protein CC80DRAFT_509772 [Byssothecium circinans]|uniref:Uncharacterized protein n=1 Tax=Byssothecium circinans TaxID=147558 RepID=A0A6A5TCC3_9PLEO|nr:hypothetical protein CC80DRAFT_509772 [Byssothecium circinans]
MAAYTPLDNSSQTNTLANKPSQYRKWTLKVLWMVQTLLVIPRIIGVLLLFILLFVISLFEPGFAFVFALVLVIDLFMCFGILVTVWKQYAAKKRNPKNALKREALKTIFATYLWLWTFITNPKKFLSRKTPGQPNPAADRLVSRIHTWTIVIAVTVILAFYPALWLAYQEWKIEKNITERGDIELQDEDEHQIRLMDRTSIDDGSLPLAGNRAKA